jgi:DNA-binding NtrC family response regulator
MTTDQSKTEILPRILWIGVGFDLAQQESGLTLSHEGDLEAGLGRLQDSSLDCVVARLSATAECEPLIELLHQRPQTIPVFVQLAENSVHVAALLAQSGVVKVYGPEASAGEILNDGREAAAGLRQRALSTAQGPWRRAMIGDSGVMRRVGDLVARVAGRRSTVLITGESGTGKEVVANALHAASGRSQRPFLAVNCSALPEGLLESELFGHTRGAFTGAVQNRQGLFELANGGTVFLDEIGDMPVSLQAKLLRVLQEQQFHRLGSCEPVRVDVRIIAATNTNLERAIVEGRFREDLFYRLNVIPIHLPALRERIEDVPVLTAHFVEKICRAEGIPLKALTPPAIARLCRYTWPGNVRQLQNVIERAVVIGSGERQVFPGDIEIPEQPCPAVPPVLAAIDTRQGLDFERTVGTFERTILEQVLKQTSGNKTRAAELLRLRRTTLSAKLRALGAAA